MNAGTALVALGICGVIMTAILVTGALWPLWLLVLPVMMVETRKGG